MVEGLEGDRTALIAKVHHAILDGVSGASILAAFLDLNPRARMVPLPTSDGIPPRCPASTRAAALRRRVLVASARPGC